VAKKWKVRGRPQKAKPKAPHTAVHDPQIPIDKLRKSVFWFSRNDGISKDIIYISTIHDVLIGRSSFGANLRVYGKITCDELDVGGQPTTGLTWGITKDNTQFPYDTQTGVTNYSVGEFDVYVNSGATTYTYEDSNSASYQKQGTYYISLNSMSSLSAAITKVNNQAHITPSNWTGSTTAVNTLSVTIYAYTADGVAVSATFPHVYTVTVEGIGGTSYSVKPNSVTLPADSQGAVSDYSGTACTIVVTEGASSLTAVAHGGSLSNGQFRVTSIVAGSTNQATSNEGTPSGGSLPYGAISSMSTPSTEIKWDIEAKLSDGSSQTSAVIQSISKATAGQDGLGVSMSVTPAAVTLASDASGNVASFAPTAATIKVLEGGTALTSVAYGGSLSAGQFKVTAISAGTTNQSTSNESGAGTSSLQYAAISSMSSDSTTIVWTLEIKKANGTTISGASVVQSISKARKGDDGRDGLSAAWKPQVIALDSTSDWTPTYGAGSFSTAAVVSLTTTLQFNLTGGTSPSTNQYSFDQTSSSWSAIAIDENGATIPSISVTYDSSNHEVEIYDGGNNELLRLQLSAVSNQCKALVENATQTSPAASVKWTGIQVSFPTSGNLGGTTHTGAMVLSIQKRAQGQVGQSGITFDWTPNAVTLPASSAGVVSDYAPAAATFKAYEGSTALTADASLSSNSTFKVVATAANRITAPTTLTHSSTTVTTNNPTSFSNSHDVASIEYTMTIKDSLGNSTSYVLNQNLTKSKAGIDGTSASQAINGKALIVSSTEWSTVGSRTYSAYYTDMTSDLKNDQQNFGSNLVDRLGFGLYSNDFTGDSASQSDLRHWEYTRVTSAYPQWFSYLSGDSVKIGTEGAGSQGFSGTGSGYHPMATPGPGGSVKWNGWAVAKNNSSGNAETCRNPAQLYLEGAASHTPFIIEDFVEDMTVFQNNTASTISVDSMTITAKVRVRDQNFTRGSSSSYERQASIFTGTARSFIDCYLINLGTDASADYADSTNFALSSAGDFEAGSTIIRPISKIPYVNNRQSMAWISGGSELAIPSANYRSEGWGDGSGKFPARLQVEYSVTKATRVNQLVDCVVTIPFTNDKQVAAGGRLALVFCAPEQYSSGVNTNMPNSTAGRIQSNPFWQVPYVMSVSSDIYGSSALIVADDLADQVVNSTSWVFGNYNNLNGNLDVSDCSSFTGVCLEIISFTLSLTTS